MKTGFELCLLPGDEDIEIKIDIEFEYTINEGQREILWPADKAQPYEPPEVEIELTSAVYAGNFSTIDLRGSKQWDKIEEAINDDDRIIEMCFADQEQNQGV